MHEIQICENMDFFLFVFQTNRSKPASLVRFLFWKIVKTKPNNTDEDFIGYDFFLTKNQSKPNRYTLTPFKWKLNQVMDEP